MKKEATPCQDRSCCPDVSPRCRLEHSVVVLDLIYEPLVYTPNVETPRSPPVFQVADGRQSLSPTAPLHVEVLTVGKRSIPVTAWDSLGQHIIIIIHRDIVIASRSWPSRAHATNFR